MHIEVIQYGSNQGKQRSYFVAEDKKLPLDKRRWFYNVHQDPEETHQPCWVCRGPAGYGISPVWHDVIYCTSCYKVVSIHRSDVSYARLFSTIGEIRSLQSMGDMKDYLVRLCSAASVLEDKKSLIKVDEGATHQCSRCGRTFSGTDEIRTDSWRWPTAHLRDTNRYEGDQEDCGPIEEIKIEPETSQPEESK